MVFTELKLFEGQVDANGDTKSNPIRVGQFKGGKFFIKATEKSGTSPTLDVDVLCKDRYTNDWYILESFTQLTDLGKEMKDIADVGASIAIQYLLGGTNPVWTFTVGCCLKEV